MIPIEDHGEYTDGGMIELRCEQCDTIVFDSEHPERFDGMHLDVRGFHCSGCVCKEELEIKNEVPKLIAVKVAELKVTQPFPSFDWEAVFAVTPEQYESGDRECYTANSWRAYCRHTCTNYEELVRELDKYNPVDQAVYDAIREAVDELIGEPPP